MVLYCRLDSGILSISVYTAVISSPCHFTSHYCGLHLTYGHFKDVVFLTFHQIKTFHLPQLVWFCKC